MSLLSIPNRAILGARQRQVWGGDPICKTARSRRQKWRILHIFGILVSGTKHGGRPDLAGINHPPAFPRLKPGHPAPFCTTNQATKNQRHSGAEGSNVNGEADGQACVQTWARRIEALGLAPLALPLVEIARAFGSLGSHALLLVQPLMNGILDTTTLAQTATLLDSPELLEQLRAHLGREGG